MQRSILYGTVLGKTSLGELRTYQDAKGNPYTVIQVALPIEHQEKQIQWEKSAQQIISQSPHLRKLYHYRYDKDQHNKYLLFEQVDGMSLTKLVADRRIRGERMKENEIIEIIFQIIKALYHLHQSNLLGRYFTPDSIIIQSNQQIVMMEYGFIGPLLPQDVKPVQSPEVLDFELYDYKIDVWLLGTVAAYLATGQLVFSSQENYNYMTWQKPKQFLIEMESNTVCIQTKSISPDLLGLIQAMLIFDPQNRWPFDIILENDVFRAYKSDPIYRQMVSFYRKFPDKQAEFKIAERIKQTDEDFLNKLYTKFRSRRAKSAQIFETQSLEFIMRGKTRYLQKQKYFNYSYDGAIQYQMFFDCNKAFELIPEELQPDFQRLGYQTYIIQQLLFIQTSMIEFDLKVGHKELQYWISLYIIDIIDDTLNKLGKLNIVRQETTKFARALRALKEFQDRLSQNIKLINKKGEPKQQTRQLLFSHITEMRKLDARDVEQELSPYYQIKLIDLNFRIYLCLLHDIIFKDAETVNKYFKKIQQFHGVRQLKDYLMIESFIQRTTPLQIQEQMEEFAEILQKY